MMPTRANEGFSNFERIKKFALIPEEWTINNGVLTPTLKVKRKVVEDRYSDLIGDIYSVKVAHTGSPYLSR